MEHDPQWQLAGERFATAEVGRGEDFLLLPLSEEIGSAVATAQERGWSMCGVLALKDGKPEAACEPYPEAAYTMMLAGLAYVHMIADRSRQPPKDDFVAFAERLYALQDQRPEA